MIVKSLLPEVVSAYIAKVSEVAEDSARGKRFEGIYDV